MKAETATAAVTAVVVRSSLPAWLRWSWAALVSLASFGGWIADHCYPPGPVGAALQSLRVFRRSGSAPLPPTHAPSGAVLRFDGGSSAPVPLPSASRPLPSAPVPPPRAAASQW